MSSTPLSFTEVYTMGVRWVYWIINRREAAATWRLACSTTSAVWRLTISPIRVLASFQSLSNVTSTGISFQM